MFRQLRHLLAVILGTFIATTVAWAAASYPTTVKSFSPKATGDVIQVTHVTDLEAEVVAIEAALLTTGFEHVLKPKTTATYDLGTDTLRWQQLLLDLGTVTADGTPAGVPAVDIRGTWNAAAVTFTAIRANITDTASAAGSLLLDLQVGGTSKFKVGKTGTATLAATLVDAGSAGAPSLSFQGDADTGLYSAAADVLGITVGGIERVRLTSSALLFSTDNAYDIGASGANRPRTGYFGTSVVSPSIGPSTTQQHTLPAVASDTIVLLNAAQTLANKTLNAAVATADPTVALGVATKQYVDAAVGGAGSKPFLVATNANLPASGAATLVRVDATNETWYELVYADTATQIADFEIPARNFTNIRLVWRTPATTGDVRFVADVREKGDADALGGGTVVATGTVVDTAKGTANQLNEATITITYTPGSGKRVAVLRISRDPAHASDTLGNEARLISVELL